MKNHINLIILFVATISVANGQSVSISPSRLYYKTETGDYKTQEVTLTNNSKRRQGFTVSFSDFEPAGMQGKSKMIKGGESPNSCVEWLSATPSFFELDPGKSQKIQVLLQVPASPDANKVKWAAMQVRLTKEKKESSSADKNAIGMGISETFQFVVHIFQSPPSVTFKEAEIRNFEEVTTVTDTNRIFVLQVVNTGEAILDCASYLEMTNMNTGDDQRWKPFAFTLLPGAAREIKFQVSRNMKKGRYSMLGVVDYGSRENVQAAEMEIEIQ